MGKRISVIIPNYNGGRTIGKCLEALFASSYGDFEAVVVDDCSSDGSREIIARFPCRLIPLGQRSGAARARNIGARNSAGEVLFFIDADCIVQHDTLSRVDRAVGQDSRVVVGGTYTGIPFDDRFFSTFQSVFIHYSETRTPHPDYVASHAMAMRRELFEKSGGFPEEFMPIIEDVEVSHRLRRSGSSLKMDASILVRHIFGFTLLKSLKNAFRKSMYWTAYSLKNRDLLADSGTASVELKVNVFSFFSVLFIVLLSFFLRRPYLLAGVPPIFVLNLYTSRRLLIALGQAKGLSFLLPAALYYMAVYPLPVGAGSLAGMMKFYLGRGILRRVR
jgi:glycosyltransferase involved in cell wall biosynthesis